MRSSFHILVCVGLLSLSLAVLIDFGKLARAQSKQPIIIGIAENHPLHFTDQNGQFQGIYIDILNAVAAQEDWKISYRLETWAECLNLLDQRQIDLLCGIALTPERVEKYLFNSETVLIDWGQIYQPVGSNIQSLADLDGKRVATVSNGILLRALTELMSGFGLSCEFIEVQSTPQVLEMIETRQADVGTLLRLSGMRFATQYAVKPSPIIFSPLQLRFAASNPRNNQLLAALDRHLKELKQDEASIYYRSMQRWLNTEQQAFRWPRWLFPVFAGLAGLSLFFLGVSIIFQRQVASRTAELKFQNQEKERQMAELQQAETLLRESEGRLRGITEAAADSIFLKNKNFEYTFVNPAMARLFGCQAAALIGKTPGEIFEPEQAAAVLDADQKTFSGEMVDIIRSINIDGVLHTFHSVQTPLPDERGEITEICGIVRDITAQRQAEELLRHRDEQFRIIFNMALDLICIADINTAAFIQVNPSFSRVLGYDEKELLSQPFMSFIHPDDVEKTVKTVNELLKKGIIVVSFENRYRCKDGSYRWLAWTSHPIPEKGVTFAIAHDITERKAVENNIRKLNRELLEKNNELEQIVYVASHDLRSPLVNIQGFSKELQHSCDDLFTLIAAQDDLQTVREKIATDFKPDVQESLGFIFKSTVKMDILLSGLLRLSRLGRAALAINRIQTNALVQDALKTFEYQIQQTGVIISYDDLPDCDADEFMLNQVFSNLIDNALKFTAPDRKARIHISGFAQADETVFSVEDNGVGIEPDYWPKIYEIFRRLDPTLPGEGLGLTIIRKILEKHQGRIWLESNPGHGSKFYFSVRNHC